MGFSHQIFPWNPRFLPGTRCPKIQMPLKLADLQSKCLDAQWLGGSGVGKTMEKNIGDVLRTRTYPPNKFKFWCTILNHNSFGSNLDLWTLQPISGMWFIGILCSFASWRDIHEIAASFVQTTELYTFVLSQLYKGCTPFHTYWAEPSYSFKFGNNLYKYVKISYHNVQRVTNPC